MVGRGGRRGGANSHQVAPETSVLAEHKPRAVAGEGAADGEKVIAEDRAEGAAGAPLAAGARELAKQKAFDQALVGHASNVA